MKKLIPSTRYKKDVKRILNNPRKLKALQEIVYMLEHEIPIPKENKPHMLTGNYAGCMECHIENDFLLIWIDPDSDVINLIRLGSHSELFG